MSAEVQELLRLAMQALMRGDTTERDRLVAAAEAMWQEAGISPQTDREKSQGPINRGRLVKGADGVYRPEER